MKRNYLLLTPGPLSTSETVREAMLQDWCTWDKDYNEGIVTPIRKGLLAIAGLDEVTYTDVLLQGSGRSRRRRILPAPQIVGDAAQVAPRHLADHIHLQTDDFILAIHGVTPSLSRLRSVLRERRTRNKQPANAPLQPDLYIRPFIAHEGQQRHGYLYAYERRLRGTVELRQ